MNFRDQVGNNFSSKSENFQISMIREFKNFDTFEKIVNEGCRDNLDFRSEIGCRFRLGL